MKKQLLFFISFLIVTAVSAQSDLRINYDANQGVSGLVGATKVYMYSGAVTTSPTGQWEWTIGSTNQDDGIGLMSPLGNNQWTICVDPMAYYSSGIAGPIPVGTPILAIDMFFRNANGTLFGYNFQGNYIIVDMTTTPPTSNFPGVVAGSCSVGINEVQVGEFVMNNFPNPVKFNTLVAYNLKDNADNVTIRVYDVIGQKVRTLVSESQKAGLHKINWNGDNDKGALLKNGLYFYTLEVNNRVMRTNRLVISR